MFAIFQDNIEYLIDVKDPNTNELQKIPTTLQAEQKKVFDQIAIKYAKEQAAELKKLKFDEYKNKIYHNNFAAMIFQADLVAV